MDVATRGCAWSGMAPALVAVWWCLLTTSRRCSSSQERASPASDALPHPLNPKIPVACTCVPGVPRSGGFEELPAGQGRRWGTAGRTLRGCADFSHSQPAWPVQRPVNKYYTSFLFSCFLSLACHTEQLSAQQAEGHLALQPLNASGPQAQRMCARQHLGLAAPQGPHRSLERRLPGCLDGCQRRMLGAPLMRCC